jgi:hypothetical protein
MFRKVPITAVLLESFALLAAAFPDMGGSKQIYSSKTFTRYPKMAMLT